MLRLETNLMEGEDKEARDEDELQKAITASFNLDSEVWKCLLFSASIAEDFSAKFRSDPFSVEIRRRYNGRVEVSYSVKEMDGTERILKKVY